MTPDIREKAERLAKAIERAALFTRGSEAWLDPAKSADLLSQALLEAHKAGREEMREEAAHAAYVACAKTRHVTLGDEAASAIRSLP